MKMNEPLLYYLDLRSVIICEKAKVFSKDIVAQISTLLKISNTCKISPWY